MANPIPVPIEIPMTNSIPMSHQINANTRPINDFKYIQLSGNDNYKINQLQMANYRLPQYTGNTSYLYRPTRNKYGKYSQEHTLYDLQGIDDGQGAGMNPDLDSELTRGNMVNLPEDRLVEKVTYSRHVDILPPVLIPEFLHHKFLVATTISHNPQDNFEPEFDIYGVCCRHYERPSDEYFRTIGKKSNKYRILELLDPGYKQIINPGGKIH